MIEGGREREKLERSHENEKINSSKCLEGIVSRFANSLLLLYVQHESEFMLSKTSEREIVCMANSDYIHWQIVEICMTCL
mgnify:CR=1 FL=1